MKIKEIDKDMIGFDKDGSTMWMRPPITAENVNLVDETRNKALDALAVCNDGEATDLIEGIEKMPSLEVSKGTAWTVRSAMFDCLFAKSYPLRKKDDKGAPIPETPESMAHVAALSICIHDAENDIELKEKDVTLIKRLCYEANQAMPVMARLFHALEE